MSVEDEATRLKDRVAQLEKDLDTARCQVIVAEQAAQKTEAQMVEYEGFFKTLSKLQQQRGRTL